MIQSHQLYSAPLYKWFMKDVENLQNACIQLTAAVSEKAARKKENIHRIEIINYHGNKFICDIQAKKDEAHHIIYKFIPHEKSFYCIAYDHTRKAIYHFRSHFFERYHLRLELHIEEAERLMNHYLHQNGVFSVTHGKRKNRRFCSCRARFISGAGYGMYDTSENIYYFRTFIAFNDMSFSKKIENNATLSKNETISLLSEKFKVVNKE